MPGNIAQYTSPVDKLQPSETGAEALFRAGRLEDEYGKQTGQYIKQGTEELGSAIENQQYLSEVSQGAATLAAIHNNFTTQWNEMATKADPNDKTIQGTFLNDTVEPQLQQFQDAFTTKRGQEWAMAQTDAMRMHYAEKTTADMASRAGNAIQLNLKTQLNNLAETARKDPSSIDQSLGQVDAVVAAAKETHADLPVEEQNKLDDMRADMKNEIVKSGLQGMADTNPQLAAAAVNHPEFQQYLKPGEGDQIIKYAEGINRMKLEDQSRAYENQKRQQEQKNQEFANQVINQVYNPDTGQVSVPKGAMQQIFSAPDIDSKTKLDLMGAIKRISTDTDITNPATTAEFTDRLRSNSPNPLTHDDLVNALATGKIDRTDFDFYKNQIKDTQDTKNANDMIADTLAGAKNDILGPNTGVPFDAASMAAYARFDRDLRANFQTAMRDPTIMPGASDTQKAHELLDPKSKVSIVPEGTMGKYKPTGDDVVQGSFWQRWFGGGSPAPAAPAAAQAPATNNAPPPGSPERKAWVQKMIFGGQQQ